MKLKIKFPDESQSFSHGVEYGRLLEKMERGDQDVTNNGFPVRIENKGLILETCAEYGYTPIFGHVFKKEWIEFLGIKKESTNN